MLLLSLGASVASPPAWCPQSSEAELRCGCLTQDGANFFGKVTALVLP